MSVPVVLALLTEDDLEQVEALQSVAFPARKDESGAYVPDTGRLTVKHLREELARPWARMWVARLPEGPVVGFLLVWHVVDELHVLNIASHPDYRRQGIARRLLDQGVTFLRERDGTRLLLEVRESNASALRLYRTFGFVEYNRRTRYYHDGEDALEMSLTLARDS